RRQQRPRLPDPGHELRHLQAVEDVPGPARGDDLVHQLGRHRGQRLVRRGRPARPRAAVTPPPSGPPDNGPRPRPPCCGRGRGDVRPGQILPGHPYLRWTRPSVVTAGRPLVPTTTILTVCLALARPTDQ